MENDIHLPRAHNPLAEAVRGDMVNLILPALMSGIDKGPFAAACIVSANQIKNPNSVTSASVLRACYDAARIGLLPGKIFNHCFFVPRKGQCCLDVGYQGYIEISTRNGFLKSVHSEVVLKGEVFERWTEESGPKIKHVIPLQRNLTRDQVDAAYCIYHTQAGGYGIELVDRAQLAKIDKKKDVWASHPIEMCRKTPVRRAAKYWQRGGELSLALAMELDDQVDAGEHQNLGDYPEQMVGQGVLSLDDLPDIPE